MPTPLDIKVTTTGAESTAESLRKIAGAATGVGEAAEHAGKGGKEASDALEQMAKKGSNVKEVYEGVRGTIEGGTESLFGFSKVWKGLKEAFAVNPVTAALGLLLGSVTLVQKGLELLVKRAEEARDEMFGTGEATKKLQEALAKVADASKKALADMQADVAKLTEEYALLNGELDRSVQRFKTVETARAGAEVAQLEQQRQAALALPGADPVAVNTKFDEKVAAVKDRSAASISNKETGAARLKKINAGEQIDKLKAKRLEISRRADDAAIAFDTATSTQAQAEARAQYETARDELEKFDTENGKFLEGARADIADADTTISANTFGERARTSTNAAQAQAKVTATRAALKDAADSGKPTDQLFRDLIKALNEAAAAQREAAAAQQQASRPNQGGTMTRGGQTTVVPGDDRDVGLRNYIESQQGVNDATSAALKDGAKEADKTAEQIKNSRT